MPTNVVIKNFAQPFKAAETPKSIVTQIARSTTGWIVLTNADNARTLGIRAELIDRMIELDENAPEAA